MSIQGLMLPELPGYRMEVSPIRNVVREWFHPDGSLAHSDLNGEKDMADWFLDLIPGRRFMGWFITDEGHRVVLWDDTITGPGFRRRGSNARCSIAVWCEYGGAFVWEDGLCSSVAGVTGRSDDNRDLEERFAQWQYRWESLDLFYPQNADAAPPEGWQEWSREGLLLSAELLALCGPEGVIEYDHLGDAKLPGYSEEPHGHALHWIPLPGREAAMQRNLLWGHS